MAQDREQKNYRITCIEDENGNRPGDMHEPTEPEQNQLEHDPLDELPDLSEQTGGLPIVTFVLICLAASSVMLIGRMLTAGSALVVAGCVGLEVIVAFGVVVLIRGMFQKLRRQGEDEKWYPISTAVMAIGIAVGLVIGVFYCL
ncbi:MAG: hypothetical protein ACI3X2_04660 [Butyricicoccus porcorum]|uniref:hypothetical protein n=1 Tax=Butyricicoccus porcorum TaxID=1945634 RepID=UPI00235303AC|nr:hypothetical protein [Butyricicoccus porcorum]MDD6987779.1 hypothetical protein [Butyricicoccus porcorum]MDY4482624.1 hypothetical protein [Butyricicoccus porcorum]